MGNCKSQQRGIPVYISLNSRIVETHELFPRKTLKPQFNNRYQLISIRYSPPHIIVKYHNGLQIDYEKTFKEGLRLQITFMPRESGLQPTYSSNSFYWYPDLHYLNIRLHT